MENSPFIKVTNLTKTYNFGRVHALDGVSLQIEPGEIFGLVGPNGAGKTTLMGCLLGLLWPSKGQIEIAGRSPSDLEVKRMTGFMPERPSFDKWMNIRQFLTYQYMLSSLPMKNCSATIDNALETVKLDRAAWKRPIRKLSRGMLQRIGLAQILIVNPKLCFLDEPTSGMDPLGMALVRDLLLRWKSEGATIVLNSHHLHEVERVCDRVAFIQKGKIHAIETMRQVQNDALFTIRWNSNNGGAYGPNHNETIETILEQLSAEFSIGLEEREGDNAKLLLRTQDQSTEVIKFLVAKGVPVAEAMFERKGLLDLFVQKGDV